MTAVHLRSGLFSFSSWTFNFHVMQMDQPCVTCTSIKWLLQPAEERSWGPYCFFLSKGCRETLSSAFQNLPESSLPTPLLGRTQRCAGFSPVVLLLSPWVAANAGFSVSPALAASALEPACLGNLDLFC